MTTKVGRTAAGRDYGYDAVMRSVEASRERLGLDRFEIVYIHDPMGLPLEEVLGKDRALGALRKLQDEGVVGFVGAAANDPDANGPFIETGEFDVAVVPDAWSLLNQSAERYIFPAVEKHDVGIAVATPIERGLLATGPIGACAARRDRQRQPTGRCGRVREAALPDPASRTQTHRLPPP